MLARNKTFEAINFYKNSIWRNSFNCTDYNFTKKVIEVLVFCLFFCIKHYIVNFPLYFMEDIVIKFNCWHIFGDGVSDFCIFVCFLCVCKGNFCKFIFYLFHNGKFTKEVNKSTCSSNANRKVVAVTEGILCNLQKRRF